jgi:uncharacterized protein
MPIHSVALPDGSAGFQWGQHGAKYHDREGAQRQAAAARDMVANSGVSMGAKRSARDSNIRQLMRNLIEFFSEEEDEPAHDENKRAAGVVVRAPDGAMLFVKRQGGDHAGEWAFPGGMREGEETPEETARRELAEETGYTPSTLEPAFATQVDGVDFATYLHDAKDKFDPKLNEEHGEHVWAMPDELPSPLHPGVAAAMATDPPVSEAQRKAMFAAASGHSKLGIPKNVGEEYVGAHDALALDKVSVRTYSSDGHLHVATTPISKAAINPYYGREIPNGKELGLDPDRVYNLLRHPDELKKAAATFNNLPLLSEHVPITSDKHPDDLVIGSTGTDAAFDGPYLKNSIVVWPQEWIDKIEGEKQKELSSAYRYRADMTPGTYDGQPYDGVMRDIVGNHVALVKEGRAGADVVVGDAAIKESTTPSKELHMPKLTKTRLGVYIHGALSTYIKKPSAELSMALDTALKDVTATSFKANDGRAKVKAAIKAIPKIAQDADLDAMHGFIDRLDNKAADDLEEDPNKKAADETEEEKKAREAAAAKDETPEEKEAREKKEAADKKARDAWESSPEFKAAKDSYDKRAKDGAGPDVDPPPTRTEMDAAMDKAIEKATKAGAAAATKVQQDIRTAEKFVQPWVGNLELAFDSAEGVYRKTCELLKIDVEGVHVSALPKLIALHPKPGARPARTTVAMDAEPPKDYTERFPGSARIQVL